MTMKWQLLPRCLCPYPIFCVIWTISYKNLIWTHFSLSLAHLEPFSDPPGSKIYQTFWYFWVSNSQNANFMTNFDLLDAIWPRETYIFSERYINVDALLSDEA